MLGNSTEGVSMIKRRRLNINIQREDALLKRSSKELTRLAQQFASKWNRISNDGRMAIERSTARSLRAANVRVRRTTKRMGQILAWLDRVRQAEKAL
jgi:hypothetical protein